MTTGDREPFDIHLYNFDPNSCWRKSLKVRWPRGLGPFDTTYLVHQTQVHANLILIILIARKKSLFTSFWANLHFAIQLKIIILNVSYIKTYFAFAASCALSNANPYFFIWANHFLFESVEEPQQREGYLTESQYINSSAESITKALLCYHTGKPIIYNMKNPCQVHREYRQCLPFLWSAVCYVLQEFIARESE